MVCPGHHSVYDRPPGIGVVGSAAQGAGVMLEVGTVDVAHSDRPDGRQDIAAGSVAGRGRGRRGCVFLMLVS